MEIEIGDGLRPKLDNLCLLEFGALGVRGKIKDIMTLKGFKKDFSQI